MEAIIILPRSLFYTTDISVTLWILNRNKKARVVEPNGQVKKYRNRENDSASKEEVEEKGFTLVPSRYIEFVNRDENVDFDTKMKTLQSELKELLTAEEKSKEDLLSVFKELGYEIKL